MARICCNPKHPKDKPQPAEYVLTRHDTPYFLCDPCSWILADLGNVLDIQELAEWEEEQLTPEDRERRDWEEWGDREYHREVDEGLLR
jgi:hypothetical protein